MGLDIRVPIGLLFAVLGGLLTLFGLFSNNDSALYERSLGINVNLWWGLVMFVFGALMILAGFFLPSGRSEEEASERIDPPAHH